MRILRTVFSKNFYWGQENISIRTLIIIPIVMIMILDYPAVCQLQLEHVCFTIAMNLAKIINLYKIEREKVEGARNKINVCDRIHAVNNYK